MSSIIPNKATPQNGITDSTDRRKQRFQDTEKKTMMNKMKSKTSRSKFQYLVCAILLIVAVATVVIIAEEKTLMPALTSLRGTTSIKNDTIVDLQTQQQAVTLKLEEEELAQLIKTHTKDEDTITELQKKLEDSKNEMDAKVKILEETVANSTTTSTTAESSSVSSVFEPHEVCSYLHSEPSTATRLWQKYLPRILDASKNPLIPELLTKDEDEKIHNVLVNILPPSRLRRAVRHMPTFSHKIVKNVIEIIQKRIQDPTNNPPLRIAVFGGSVTIGRGCRSPKGMNDFACAWPKRLELLINQFAKMDVVQIYNLGVGGTGSSAGTKRIKYWMYPAELAKVGPDVIINSYSTNDSLPPFDIKPEEDHVTIVADKARKGLQDFVRESLQSKRCSIQPLVVHVDDYVGPQQQSLLGELSYTSAMTQLAKWYDTVGISYGEVVRDIVYQNNEDTTFAAIGDVHYGRFAHQTIAWSVGFASLELLTNYCDDEYNARTYAAAENVIVKLDHTDAKSMKDTIRENKLFLPPPLTRDLLLNNATEEFNAALDAAHQSFVDNNCTSIGNGKMEEGEIDHSPCNAISWLAAPGAYDGNAIKRFMRRWSTANVGWDTERSNAEGWSNKDGWIATKANAKFTMKFDNLEKDVRTVTFYFIRSYGDKWKDSNAKFVISRLNEKTGSIGNATGADEVTILLEQDIAGVHAQPDYNYSLTLSETMSISDVKKGETLNIEVDLTSGQHFKIMGLMLCNK